jgi:hypothetical protein
MSRIPQAVLAAIPKSREVIAMADAVEAGGRFYLLKFVLRNRTTEVVVMPPVVAFHISRSVGDAIGQLKYRDLRRRAGDSRPEFPAIRAALDNQPNVQQSDWDSAERSQIAIGCEVRAFPDGLFLGFNIDAAGSYRILAVPPTISFYLVDMIERARREGAMRDIGTEGSPSDHKH